FFDTTSTYFETETGDEPLWRDAKGNPVATTIDTTADGDGDDDGGELPSGAVKQAGFRTYGKSKDHREVLPQVVVGMAVTREGIPVRVWCWPGNTSGADPPGQGRHARL